jgi:hypothetical protein
VDIIKLSADALAPIVADGITVQQGWYEKNINDTHVTLWSLGTSPEAFSDDENDVIGGDVQVTIFSNQDEVALARRIKKLMVAAGFTWTGGSQDDTQNDGGIFMKPQRFHFDKEETEE